MNAEITDLGFIELYIISNATFLYVLLGVIAHL